MGRSLVWWYIPKWVIKRTGGRKDVPVIALTASVQLPLQAGSTLGSSQSRTCSFAQDDWCLGTQWGY